MRKEIGRLGCRWMRGCAVIAVILETCLVTQGALAERYAQRETQLQSAQITRSALVAQTTRVTQISQTPQSIQPVQSITTSKGKEGTQKYVLPGVDSDSPEMAGRNTLPVDLAMALDSATATGGRPLVIPGVEPKCHWFTEWNDALHASKGLNRPLLVHFSMEYCGPCKRMEETVFSEETIQMLAGSYFVLLKIDGNKNPTIRDRFGVKAFPSDFVVLPDGKILARHTGYQDRTKYSSFLTNAAARVNLPALTTPIDENWRVTQNVPVPQPTVVAEAKTVQTGIPPQETAQVKALQMEPAQVEVPQQETAQVKALQMEVAQVEATQQETIHVKALQMEPAMQASSVTPESELSEILAPPALETNSETKLEGTLVQVASETAEIVEADDGTNYVAAEHTEEALDITSSSELESAGEYDLLSLEVAPTLSDDLSEQETEVHELHSPLEHEAKIVVQSEEEMPSDELDAVKTWGEAKTTPSPNLYHAGYAPKMPMLLDGYCPVTMVEANKWEIGNKEIFAHYANGVYFFASINAYEKFIQNPAYYALVSDGLDIVQLADNNQRVHGTRRFGIRYDDLNFVFATEENRDKFRENPDHYAKMARRIIAKEMEVETGRR